MKTSIQLTPDQEVQVKRLISQCAEIELRMNIELDVTDFNSIEQKLTRLCECLAHTPKMMEMATVIYSTAKGMAADEYIKSSSDLKQDILRLFLSGKLARWEALYCRVETLTKDLRNQIEGLRSILSFEKERARLEIGTAKFTT